MFFGVNLPNLYDEYIRSMGLIFVYAQFLIYLCWICLYILYLCIFIFIYIFALDLCYGLLGVNIHLRPTDPCL